VDGCNETVSAPRKRFDKSRVVGGVVEGNAEFADSGIEAFVEADVGVGRPEARLQLLTRDYFSGMLKEHREDAKRLLLQRYPAARLMHFARAEVDFEEPGADTLD
jgi:hypothetical protein